MNKDIENLINPPWLESFQRLKKQANFSNLALQESETMRSIQKLTESTKWTSFAFGQSEFMKSAQLVAENSKLASLAFHESKAMKSIREFTESSSFTAFALQESALMNSLNALAKSTQLSSMAFQQPEIEKQLKGFAKTSQLASIALNQSQAFNQISQLNSLASFKALAKLHNSPFASLASVDFAKRFSTDQITDDSLLEIDSQISEEILSETDFNSLSEKTKSILIYLYHYYFLPIFLSCLSAYMMTNALEARKELESISTPNEVKTFVRSSSGNFDRLALKGFRVTIGDDLNFREAPNMKSEIITTLPMDH